MPAESRRNWRPDVFIGRHGAKFMEIHNSDFGAKPSVTVAILTYNYGRYIERSIESVMSQSSSAWRLVICDDASTDDTECRVKPYLKDSRISYVRHNANLGQGANWAFALRQGQSEIMTVLHGDDEWLPNAVHEATASFTADSNLDLFFGDVLRDDGNGCTKLFRTRGCQITAVGKTFFRDFLTKGAILPSAAFLSRRIIDLAGPPDPTYKMVVDFEFFSRVVINARRVKYTANPLCIYHVHGSSVSTQCNNDGTTASETERMTTEIPPRLMRAGAHPSDIRLFEYIASRSIFEQGISDIVRGREQAGTRRMRFAVRRHYSVLFKPRRLVDWFLIHLGIPGRFAMRLLHRGR